MRYSFLFVFMLISCSESPANKEANPTAKTAVSDEPIRVKNKLSGKKNWHLKDFYSDDPALAGLVDSIYNKLSTAEKAAQMIMMATSEYKGIGVPFQSVLTMYNKRLIGSVLFLKGRRSVFSREINILNKAVEDNKIFPAVFACDCEPSLFHKKFTDADSLTPASMLRSVSEVRQMALVISEEMKKMGIQWNFAPVADISDNQEIINDRSFGNDDSEVIEKSVAFIQTSESNNIATSVKHFPGHGAVKGDSHKNLVYIDSVFKELNNFSAIFKQANPVSVMAGHIAVRNIPGLNTSGKPATLSEKIIKRLLKDSLNFKGIVVTDAMNMGAVKNIKNADFMAVQAGNDLVLIPNNPRDLHRRIVQLIKEKSKSSEKVIASIKKIIRLKICLGLL